VRLIVNGEIRTVDDRARVADVVSAVTARASGIAVAVNGDVVPRSAWPDLPLRDGDTVEVLTAVQGG
jgi:sulfur carrier protein